MKKFDEFINENEKTPVKIQYFFEDLIVKILKNLFGENRIDGINVSINDKWMNVNYTISCSDHDDENEHKINMNEDGLSNNAKYTLKVLKHSANVIEKSASFFNRNPADNNEMETSWNHGNFGMGISLTLYLNFHDFIQQHKPEIPNEIRSLLGISKFNL